MCHSTSTEMLIGCLSLLCPCDLICKFHRYYLALSHLSALLSDNCLIHSAFELPFLYTFGFIINMGLLMSACALITVRVLLIWHPFRQHFSTKLNAYLLPVTNTPCSAEVRCVSFKNKPMWRSVWLCRINCVALGCFTFLHCLCRLTLEVVSCNTNIPQASYVA